MKLSHIQILVPSLGLSLVLTVAGCSRSAKTERSAKTNDAIQVGVVTIGNQFGKDTIIASGIEAGERLITSGQKDIAPGIHIKIKADNGHFLASE